MTRTVIDAARAAFEADYFGNLPMTSEARSRNGDGYSFSLPQTAWATWWTAWQAAIAGAVPVTAYARLHAHAEMLAARVLELEAAIASMSGWISVDERLPFVRVDVLIARGTGPSCERTIAFYDPDRYTPAWRYKDDPAEGIRGVTHWQPMPSPPTPKDPPIAALAAKETT